ncbi:MAG TPA: peptidoglycan-binding domain-containing protein [Bryobacteraceae bacterium]|nr:peptidoglycan-binding domain-containing protein [Bryobacteraceae bacterium]
MHSTLKKIENVGFTLALAAGMTGFAALAQSPAYNDQSVAPQNNSVQQQGRNFSTSMIRHAQRELKDQGYYRGRVDGIMGPETHRAIREYQRSENLAETGRLNRATASSLGLSNEGQYGQQYNAENNQARQERNGEAGRSAEEPQTTQGNSSPEAQLSSDVVRSAQQQLRQDGFYNGPVDGMMNQGTRAAIRQYQKQNNLPETGRLTRGTAQSLGINTSNQRFENGQGSGLEQLGRGIAEGAQTNNNQDQHHNQNQNQNQNRQYEH